MLEELLWGVKNDHGVKKPTFYETIMVEDIKCL